MPQKVYKNLINRLILGNILKLLVFMLRATTVRLVAGLFAACALGFSFGPTARTLMSV